MHERHFDEKTHRDESRDDKTGKVAACLHERHFDEKTHRDESRDDKIKKLPAI